MKLYLAGRMKNMPLMNKEKFDKYEKKFVELGHQVFNPHRVNAQYPHLKEVEYMGIDLQQISVSDAIILIPNWNESKGATFEVYFVLNYGIPVYCAESGQQLSWSDVKINISTIEDSSKKSIFDV